MEVVDQLSEIDWNSLFEDLPPTSLEQEDPTAIISNNQTVETWVEELLMKDDDDNEQQQQLLDSALENEFLWSDLLIDSPKIDFQPSDDKISNSTSCSNFEEDNVNIVNTTTNYDYGINDNHNNVNSSSNDDDDGGEGVNGEKSENDKFDDTDDDPIYKKRKRQLRNRDAALRSRERKKMYVKDLEMKSQYMEAEVRRLGRLLQCCYAENQMLRISLGNAYGASMAKPESAVLLLESLLLVSLVWLMVNICLLPLPKLPLLNQCAVPHESVERKDLGSAALNGKGTKVIELSVTFSFMRSKRCRASRTKMKSEFDRGCFFASETPLSISTWLYCFQFSQHHPGVAGESWFSA